MSERVRRVVASPKTENISATALVVMAKAKMLWSVKSTVSIVSLHYSVQPLARTELSFATLTQTVSFDAWEQRGNRLCVPPDGREINFA
jgi:hypothetical protein